MKPEEVIEEIHAIHENEVDTDKHEHLIVEAALRAIDDVSAMPRLYAALARAQGKFPAIPRNRTVKVQTKTGGSYTFDYAPLETILDHVRQPLAEEGLAITQPLQVEETKMFLVTMLLHADGGMLTSKVEIPNAQGRPMQELGSALTYLRRYSIQGILGIATEEDDDANAADGNTVAQKRDRQRPVGETPKPVAADRQEQPSPPAAPSPAEVKAAWIQDWDAHTLAQINAAVPKLTGDEAREALILEGGRKMRGKGEPRKTVLGSLSDRIRELEGGPQAPASDDGVSQAATGDDPPAIEPASPSSMLLQVKAAIAFIQEQPSVVEKPEAWRINDVLTGLWQSGAPTTSSLDEVPDEWLGAVWQAVPDDVQKAVASLGPEALSSLAAQAK